MIIRQGDVLLRKLSALPSGLLETVAPENGVYTLALGETTGHTHTIPAPGATMRRNSAGVRYMTIDELTTFDHQEHGTLPLPVGIYEVSHPNPKDLKATQREYTPEGLRSVGD